MKRKIIYWLLFLGITSCRDKEVVVPMNSEVVSNGNDLFYQFGSLSGHLASLAFDKAGNLYAADNGNNFILKIDSSRKVTRFAGNGLYGHVDGTLTSASFLMPTGLAFDVQGNLYVSETSFIRKITKDGQVSTVAGSLPDKNSPSDRYKDGPALLSKFSNINLITIDSVGNIYVVDTYNAAVRKVSQDQQTVSTIAGNTMVGYVNGSASQAEFNYPKGITYYNNGIYITDVGNSSIRKVEGNVVYTIAGSNKAGFEDGYSNSAKFRGPRDLVFDKNGILYITDTENQAIRRVDKNGKVTTLDIKGPGSKLMSPDGIAIYEDNLYVADMDRIVKIFL